ncbi:MAG: hypothetical protein QXZ63_04615 [Sulfolobales archaeon]
MRELPYLRLVFAVVIAGFTLVSIFIPNSLIYVLAGSSDFELVGYGWNTPSEPERVYPGASRVRYYVSLLYSGGGRVSKVYAELYLPRGVTTYSEGSNIVYMESDAVLDKYDITTLEFSNLNISNSLRPGTYRAELRLTYVIASGMSYSITMYVPMIVNDLPQQISELVDYFWSTRGGLRRALTPGFREVDLVFYLRVRDDVVIRNIYAILLLPEGFSCGDLRNATAVVNNVRYIKGDVIDLRFSNIKVGDGLPADEFNLTLHVIYQLDLYGLTINVSQSFNITSRIDYESFKVLELVSSFWGSDRSIPVYPNTSKASLSITLMNVGVDPIYGLIGKLTLPEGFTHLYGGKLVNSSYVSRLSSGGTATLVFSDINLEPSVSPGEHILKLMVEYFIDSGGSSVRVYQEFNLTMHVSKPGDPISVVGVRWVNNYGVAFPASREELEVTLANWDEHAVTLIEPKVRLPSNFSLLSIGGDCFNGISSYSTCSLRLMVDVGSDVGPGSYEFNVELKYLVRISESDVVRQTTLIHEFRVCDPEAFGAKLIPATALWGDTANPREALPGNKLLPLSIELVNVGRDVAAGVIADISLPQGFKLAYPEGRASCDRVDRGGSCLLRYQVDIDPWVEPGNYVSKLVIRYVTYFNSANLSKVEIYNISLPVSDYPRELRLHVVDANWSNNLPAYPGDEAVFTVRVANLGPYVVSSIISKLELPEGFTCDEGRSCNNYFSGPLQQYQQFNASFKVLIGKEVEPGPYIGNLTLDYVVQVGGYGIRLTDVYTIKIYVTDISNAISLIGVYWVNTTPSKGDAGLMRIVLRCDSIPSLKGLVLKLSLPNGVVAIPNNSSSISIPYYQQLQLAGIPYMGGLPMQLVTQTGITQGDMMYVDLPVRILEIPHDPTMSIVAEFLDHWNSLQEVVMDAAIQVLNKSRILVIEPVENVVTAGKAADEVRFKFTNLGDSQIYNLVVFGMSPYSGISIADPAKFVDVVGGGNSATLVFKVTANPGVIEGPYPVIFAVIYQDFSGRVYTLNMTSTLIVKGLEAIKLLSPQVSPEVVANGSTITFSTTIVNEGKTPLRHVVVSLRSEAIYEESTYYIGNIDPDSQIPVSLKALVRADAPEGNYGVKVSIIYYDVFHELRSYEETYYIRVVANVTTTQTPVAFEFPVQNMLMLLGVIAFVACVTVFYLLWFKKKVGRSAEHS